MHVSTQDFAVGQPASYLKAALPSVSSAHILARPLLMTRRSSLQTQESQGTAAAAGNGCRQN